MQQEILKSKTLKIYKRKQLNNADFNNFSHSDYQIFLYLITKIGGVNQKGKYLQPEELQREHILTAKEYSSSFNTDMSLSYKQINKACRKLMKSSLFIEKLGCNEIWEINVCSTAKYNKSEGKITIKFTDDIMPYLSQVKEKFMLYNIREISNFGSLYTTRLYELLQEYKTTGWMQKSVQELRQAFSTGTKHSKYNDFKRKTFGRACKEINDNHPSMKLHFEEKKDGRKVASIKFLFNAKK
jgi:plasmid replication initiation protein